MKKIILGMLILCIVTPAVADIISSPEVVALRAEMRASAERKYAEAQEKCPKDKPLYFNGECHSCDDPEQFPMRTDSVEKCSEICANRKVVKISRHGRFWHGYCGVLQ